jgi:hypothetical protein
VYQSEGPRVACTVWVPSRPWYWEGGREGGKEGGREGGREGQVVEVEGEDGKEREGRQEWKCMGGMVRNRHLR